MTDHAPASSGGRIRILLPVLNEAPHIEPLWTRIADALAGHDYVICFVDDGSSDGTVERLQRLASDYPTRAHLIRRRKMMRGSQRGGALFAGLQWALARSPTCNSSSKWTVTCHIGPKSSRRGLDLVVSGACDVAIASKYLPGSKVINRPLGRRAVKFFCNRMVRLLLSNEITDYSNGFRFYSRGAAMAIATAQI